MSDDQEKRRIDGKDATYIALAQQKYPPLTIERSTETDSPNDSGREASARLPERADNSAITRKRRTPPPRVRKPSSVHDKYEAPPGEDHEKYRARLRETFGDTLSNDFVDFALGKLIEALKPNPQLQLDEKTFNAALAMLHSAECRTELQASVAIEAIAAGLAGLRFLRQSQHHMTEEYINTYGPIGIKLLRLKIDLMRALDGMQRSSAGSVEIGNVNIEPGAQVAIRYQSPET
jgi:hypothetical protein